MYFMELKDAKFKLSIKIQIMLLLAKLPPNMEVVAQKVAANGIMNTTTLNQSGSLQFSPMSNILPSMDRLHNLLKSYLQLNPSLPIHCLPSSSSSMHLTKANREKANNLDPMAGILDSRMLIEIMRRNTLMILRVKRPSNSRKARETKCSSHLSPMTMLSLDLLLLSNLQIVSTSWIPLQTF